MKGAKDMDGFPSEVSESAPHLEVFAPTSQLAAARIKSVGSPTSGKGSSSAKNHSSVETPAQAEIASESETSHGCSASSPTKIVRSSSGKDSRQSRRLSSKSAGFYSRLSKARSKESAKPIVRPSDDAPRLKPMLGIQVQLPEFGKSKGSNSEGSGSNSKSQIAEALEPEAPNAIDSQHEESEISELAIRTRRPKTNRLRIRQSPSKLAWLSGKTSRSDQTTEIVEDLQQGSLWEGALTSLPSWLVSTILHLVLLILLALLSMGGDLGKQAVVLEIAEAGESPDTMSSEIDFTNLAVETPFDLELTELEPLELEATEIPLEMMEVFDGSDSNQLFNDANEEHGFGSRQTGGSSSDSIAGPGAKFFGVESSGNRFVFVIDCSGSMGGSRWYRAVKELNEAISNLEPSQEFLVLLYNSGMSVMMNESIVEANLVVANQDNKLRSKRWLRKQRPNGGTYPSQAMFAALILDPDAIFLLSDGELQDNTVSLLRVWNVDREDSYGAHSKIPIHTISLGPPGGGQRMMKRIAEDNDGEFTWAQ
jgi:hypothetical protein